MSYKYKHGLAIMRAQPFHIGHEKIINKMLEQCNYVTIALGSIQEHGTDRNPLSYNIRKKLLQNIYKNNQRYDNLKIIGLFDINNPAEWAEYVVDFLVENFADFGRPDVYYAGSQYDAHWFMKEFENIEIVDRINKEFPFVSASMIRDMLKFGDSRWKDFIHPENHKLIEDNFNKRKAVI